MEYVTDMVYVLGSIIGGIVALTFVFVKRARKRTR